MHESYIFAYFILLFVISSGVGYINRIVFYVIVLLFRFKYFKVHSDRIKVISDVLNITQQAYSGKKGVASVGVCVKRFFFLKSCQKNK